MVSKGDEDTPTSATHLTVKNWVEDWIIALNILGGGRNERAATTDKYRLCDILYNLQVLTCTRSGLPNRRALSRFLRKASSRKL